jgi:trans-2,3-dihydro-3-hydroxyanthranilate isomerase
MRLPFRILNVFPVEGERLSGNPLCVFEDGRGLSEAQMQALARQLNLSETTFILPPSSPQATAAVRIFTPSFELPFAGHPSLGTAAVVHELLARGGEPEVTLEMRAGLVAVRQRGSRWQLRTARAPTYREVVVERKVLADMLGLSVSALLGPPLWVNTGAEQLILPLTDATEVAAVRPDPALLAAHAFSEIRGGAMAYVWAPDVSAEPASEAITARFFFLSNGGVIEDAATGSACANLGGWYLAQRSSLPLRRVISQGQAIHRPSRLELEIDADGAIFVAGGVLELGRGALEL